MGLIDGLMYIEQVLVGERKKFHHNQDCVENVLEDVLECV
jgi:hypothetical protein